MVNVLIFLFLLVVFIIFLFLYVKYAKRISDKKWWETHKFCNFPIRYKGKTVWVSRSVAVIGFVFCQDENGDWYVLANQRGKGTPDYQGYWNVICGYLDYNECGEDAVSREIHEETGLNVDAEKFELCRVNTLPSSDDRQNVTLGYVTILDGTIDDHSDFSKKYMEKDEVADIKWVKISTLYLYEWAFGHFDLINMIYKNKIDKDA